MEFVGEFAMVALGESDTGEQVYLSVRTGTSPSRTCKVTVVGDGVELGELALAAGEVLAEHVRVGERTLVLRERRACP